MQPSIGIPCENKMPITATKRISSTARKRSTTSQVHVDITPPRMEECRQALYKLAYDDEGNMRPKWKAANPKQRFAQFLKIIRGDLSLRAFGPIVDISHASLGAYEKQTHDPSNISIDTLEKIGARAGYSLDDFRDLLEKGILPSENGSPSQDTPSVINPLQSAEEFIDHTATPADLVALILRASIRLHRMNEDGLLFRNKDTEVHDEHDVPLPEINQRILADLEARQSQLGMTDDQFAAFAKALGGIHNLEGVFNDLQIGEAPDVETIGHLAALCGVSIDDYLALLTTD